MWDETDSLENNPFAYLFPTLEEARKYAREAAEKSAKENVDSARSGCRQDGENEAASTSVSLADPAPVSRNKDMLNARNITLTQEERITEIVEDVFGVTLKVSGSKRLVWSDEFESKEDGTIDTQNLGQILMERLLMADPSANLLHIQNNKPVDAHVIEKQVIKYLVECYKRLVSMEQLSRNQDLKETIQIMQTIVVGHAATALRVPELFKNQNLNSQVLQMFSITEDNENILKPFFTSLVEEIIKDNEKIVHPEDFNVILTVFTPLFSHVHKQIANSNMVNFDHCLIFSFLQTMASNKYLAAALMDYCTPQIKSPGKVYSDTLLGAIFCISCLPKVNEGSYDFFDSFMNMQAVKNDEASIWTSLSGFCDQLHQLFLTLLKVSPEVKHKTLSWIADCLHANADRGKLGQTEEDQMQSEIRGQNVSDGFMLNMTAVLLRLCQPFVADWNGSKILKIDPTYCAANVTTPEEAQRRSCHMRNLYTETCLLPIADGEERLTSDQFNFITECYFMAEKSLDLGFRVCAEKVNKAVEDLAKIQQAYSDAVGGGGVNHEVAEQFQERIQSLMPRYLSYKAALLEPKALGLLCKLHAASANWLIQILLNAEESSTALTAVKPLEIPLSEEVPILLKSVPEFVFVNLITFLTIIKRYDRKTFEENGSEWMEPILSLIVLFMGSLKRISNPHLRAALAESMEALLPNNDDQLLTKPPVPLGTICREQLFQNHPLSKLFVPSLLSVFVSIEMTGQSVQFQEKFNYRRPMYVVMDYLWTFEVHREIFRELARDADENMEAVVPPLFLRFVNLLINDAVFLLDEALSNMAKLKKIQASRESGQWARLPIQERLQNESLYMEASMYAKFDNILGQWTIHTLKLLTSEITTTFQHPVLVDRMAAMLNYFLQHLVGPNKKNFNVKDKEEYKFKPDVFVKDICQIYVNLYRSEEFCLAVSRDGRSYNKDLFRQAQDVLARIGGGILVAAITEVDQEVSKMASRQIEEEQMLPDAPDEFLDPIMSTIMRDPVILPSSLKVVDRTTIARHLLSDESDPFNRSPLTLDKVIPHTELREKIESWLEERRRQQTASTSKSDEAEEDKENGDLS